MRTLLFICLAIAGLGFSGDRAARCQFDGLNATWTGQTQVVNARTYYVMKCLQGHTFLAESPQ